MDTRVYGTSAPKRAPSPAPAPTFAAPRPRLVARGPPTLYNCSAKKGRWSDAESTALADARAAHREDWAAMSRALEAQGFESRTPRALQRQWDKMQDRTKAASAGAAGIWTQDEDDRIWQLWQQHRAKYAYHLRTGGRLPHIEWAKAQGDFPGRARNDLGMRLYQLKRKAAGGRGAASRAARNDAREESVDGPSGEGEGAASGARWSGEAREGSEAGTSGTRSEDGSGGTRWEDEREGDAELAGTGVSTALASRPVFARPTTFDRAPSPSSTPIIDWPNASSASFAPTGPFDLRPAEKVSLPEPVTFPSDWSAKLPPTQAPLKKKRRWG
ncbi:hypothetical protein JCM10449v2_002087 [Rhodotorula kratochvilovae]